jgi:hypothetical protein
MENKKMLNPKLYNLLRERLGSVRVVKEGEPMVTKPMPPDKDGRPQMQIESWGEGYKVDCPLCKDTKARLFVSHRYGVHDPATGSDNLQLCKCFRRNCQKDPDRRKLLADKIFGLRNYNQRQQVATSVVSPVTTSDPSPDGPAEATESSATGSLPAEGSGVASAPYRAL